MNDPKHTARLDIFFDRGRRGKDPATETSIAAYLRSQRLTVRSNRYDANGLGDATLGERQQRLLACKPDGAVLVVEVPKNGSLPAEFKTPVRDPAKALRRAAQQRASHVLVDLRPGEIPLEDLYFALRDRARNGHRLPSRVDVIFLDTLNHDAHKTLMADQMAAMFGRDGTSVSFYEQHRVSVSEAIDRAAQQPRSPVLSL